MNRSLSREEQELSDKACNFVKENKEEIIKKIAGDAFPPTDRPISLFMAGSPGAGKTEISKALITVLDRPIVRIDGDEIRNMLPGYEGFNSSIFQRPITIGVDRIHKYVLEKRKSFILDGTFSNLERARENIERSLSRKREVVVVYVYQEPTVAWRFTQKREKEEGRSISRDTFIEQLYASKATVQKIKEEFGKEVEVWLIERNLETSEFKMQLNIDRLDSYIAIPYLKDELERILPL